MIGILDSGEGAENTLKELRLLLPSLDVLLFKDRKNSPYGTKAKDELIAVASSGVDRLIREGCERVLIACCTASTVHSELEKRYRECSIPIILPTAHAALAASQNGKIALIATDATVRSHAFSHALGSALTAEIAASRLVCEIENGARDGKISDELTEYLTALTKEIAASGADTLILGCTHFVRLRGEIERAYEKETRKKIIIVDSAAEGARALAGLCAGSRGEGRIKRIE